MVRRETKSNYENYVHESDQDAAWCNDTCLIEVGYPSLEAAIRQRQRKFISRMKKERENMYDDPLMFALDITERDNPTMQRYLSGVLCEDGDIVQNDISRRKERLLSS